MDKRWYPAQITSYKRGAHRVIYDDGEIENLDLKLQLYKLLRASSAAKAKPKRQRAVSVRYLADGADGEWRQFGNVRAAANSFHVTVAEMHGLLNGRKKGGSLAAVLEAVRGFQQTVVASTAPQRSGMPRPAAVEANCDCAHCEAVKRFKEAQKVAGGGGPSSRPAVDPHEEGGPPPTTTSRLLLEDDGASARSRAWEPARRQASKKRPVSGAPAADVEEDFPPPKEGAPRPPRAAEGSVHRAVAARGRAYRTERRSQVRGGQGDLVEALGGGVHAEASRHRLRFARSKIHAWGVVADEPIRQGDFVLEYRGEIIGNAVVEKRALDYEANNIIDYMFRVDLTETCDATFRGSLARFVNHSCAPNVVTQIVKHAQRKKIALYAKRDIAAGEELAYDYKFPIEAVKIPCACGAPTCRGSLN